MASEKARMRKNLEASIWKLDQDKMTQLFGPANLQGQRSLQTLVHATKIEGCEPRHLDMFVNLLAEAKEERIKFSNFTDADYVMAFEALRDHIAKAGPRVHGSIAQPQSLVVRLLLRSRPHPHSDSQPHPPPQPHIDSTFTQSLPPSRELGSHRSTPNSRYQSRVPLPTSRRYSVPSPQRHSNNFTFNLTPSPLLHNDLDNGLEPSFADDSTCNVAAQTTLSVSPASFDQTTVQTMSAQTSQQTGVQRQRPEKSALDAVRQQQQASNTLDRPNHDSDIVTMNQQRLVEQISSTLRTLRSQTESFSSDVLRDAATSSANIRDELARLAAVEYPDLSDSSSRDERVGRLNSHTAKLNDVGRQIKSKQAQLDHEAMFLVSRETIQDLQRVEDAIKEISDEVKRVRQELQHNQIQTDARTSGELADLQRIHREEKEINVTTRAEVSASMESEIVEKVREINHLNHVKESMQALFDDDET